MVNNNQTDNFAAVFLRRNDMRTDLIIKYIGKSLLLESLFMVVSAAVSVYNGYDEAFFPMLFSSILTATTGAFPAIFVKGKNDLSVREGYYIVGLSWIFCCIFGSFPYLFYGIDLSDSVFESVSGFTTTGASILSDIRSLPPSLLFWRMSTAWIGGIGIIALFSLVSFSAGRNKSILTSVEGSEIATSYSRGHRQHTIGKTITTYSVLTGVAIFCLKFSGMRWFDAVTHAMSAASTCGFSTKNESIAAFGNPIQEAILIVTMILASIRFDLLGGMLYRGGLKRMFKSEVTCAFLLMIFCCTMMTSIDLYRSGTCGNMFQCLRLSVFQATSILTTTGFATADTNTWPVLSKSLLMAGALVCGCSGSTSGGLKTDRFVTALKAMRHRLQLITHPNQIILLRVEGRVVGQERMLSVLSFCVCFILIIIIGALAYCSLGIDMETAWTAAVACMSNVGPGMGEAGSMSNYAFMPDMAKWISVSLMMLGRLEIFPLLTIFIKRAKD